MRVSKTNIFFSRFEGMRGEKTQIFRTKDIQFVGRPIELWPATWILDKEMRKVSNMGWV